MSQVIADLLNRVRCTHGRYPASCPTCLALISSAHDRSHTPMTTDPVAEFIDTPSTPSFAHQVVPPPDGHHWFDPNQPTEDLPRDLARYHIARAYGFYLATVDVNHPRLAEAMTHMLAEYQLASIWFRLACTDTPDAEQVAVDVVTDLASPQVIGSNILELMEWANIAPGAIRPYMAGAQEPTADRVPSDAERRDPAATLARALEGWTEWLPGDGTSYRVHVDVISGGPDHADRVLLVNCARTTIAVQYVDPQVAGYRADPWTASKWAARQQPSRFGGYDAWPVVVKPLLMAAGAAR